MTRLTPQEELRKAREEESAADRALLDAEVEATQSVLNPRRRAFVLEYVKDKSGSQAAIRAGYSVNTAAVTGSQLLNTPNVRAAVDKLIAQRIASVGMTRETVLHEMALLATSCLEHYVLDDEGQVNPAPGAPEGVMSAIKSIKRKVRAHYNNDGDVASKTFDVEVMLWDKPTPLKIMGRHLGLFPDRVEVTGKDGAPLEVTEIRRTIVDPKETSLG